MPAPRDSPGARHTELYRVILTSAEYQPAGDCQPAQAGDRQRVQEVWRPGGEGGPGPCHWGDGAVDDVDTRGTLSHRQEGGTNYRQQEAVLFVLWPTLFLECHKVTTECIWFFCILVFLNAKRIDKEFQFFTLHIYRHFKTFFSHKFFSTLAFFHSWHIDMAFYKRKLETYCQ